MIALLAVLVLLNISDAILTHFLIHLDIAYEGNPLLNPLAGKPIFIVVKVVGVIFAAFVLKDIHRRRRRLALTVTAVFVLAYSIIVGWNASLFF